MYIIHSFFIPPLHNPEGLLIKVGDGRQSPSPASGPHYHPRTRFLYGLSVRSLIYCGRNKNTIAFSYILPACRCPWRRPSLFAHRCWEPNPPTLYTRCPLIHLSSAEAHHLLSRDKGNGIQLYLLARHCLQNSGGLRNVPPLT